MKYLIQILIIILPLFCYSTGFSVQQNNVLEWSLFSEKRYTNPFYDIELVLIIKDSKGNKLRLPAFWKGNNEWGVRFSTPNCGDYTFITECSDQKNKNLHNQKGKIKVVAYSGRNPLYLDGPIQISKNKHNIEHLDGKPFLWLADSWWYGMSKRISYNDFCLLVNDRKQKGFNVIQFAIGFACDIEPFDERDSNEAGLIWEKNLSSINPEYFSYTDKRIQYLVEAGLMPNLVGAWAYYIHTLGTERMKKHWQYLIARYGAYPISWTLCGEAGLAWYKAEDTENQLEIQRKEWSVIAEFIKQNNPFQRLLTVHSGPNSGNHLPIEQMRYIDFFYDSTRTQ